MLRRGNSEAKQVPKPSLQKVKIQVFIYCEEKILNITPVSLSFATTERNTFFLLNEKSG